MNDTFGVALRMLVESDRPSASRRCLTLLSDPGPEDISAFRAAWSQVPEERRRWIARSLLAAAQSDFHVSFKPLFQLLLEDRDADVRCAGVDGLFEERDVRLVGQFVKLLREDPEPSVRSRAAVGLGPYVELGQLDRLDATLASAALAALTDAAADESEDPEVRRRATESAGYADYSEVGLLIESAIDSDLADLRAGALRAMGNSADDRWAPDVVSELDDPSAAIRLEAARAAGSLAIGAAVPGLVALVEDPDLGVQTEAVRALGEIGGEMAREVLEELLTDVDDERLEEAIEDALASMTLSDGEMPWSALMDDDGDLDRDFADDIGDDIDDIDDIDDDEDAENDEGAEGALDDDDTVRGIAGDDGDDDLDDEAPDLRGRGHQDHGRRR